MAQESSKELFGGNYHRVIPLHDEESLSFEKSCEIAPDLPKGWYELAKLSKEDRVELKRDYWESVMRGFPKLCAFIENFFSRVEDVRVYLIQSTEADGFTAQIVYVMDGEENYYRGFPPASEEEIIEIENLFFGEILPPDYIAFFRIHNGFLKTTDATGLIPTSRMSETLELFSSFFEEDEVIYSKNGLPVNPKKLFPFYKSFGMPYYQCFWAEWFPGEEMGNVYCSLQDKRISQVSDKAPFGEHLSFHTFSEWLSFYLEPEF